MQKLALRYKPKLNHTPPQQPIRRFAFQLIHTQQFEKASLVLIILNTLAMAVTWYPEPALLSQILLVLEIVFLVAFFVELLLKVLALGFYRW